MKIDVIFERAGAVLSRINIDADSEATAVGMMDWAFKEFRKMNPGISLWDDEVSIRFERTDAGAS